MKLHSSEEVVLVQVPGSWFPCNIIHPSPKANNENSIKAFDSIKPKKISKHSDILCNIPSIPAVPPFIEDHKYKKLYDQIEILAPLKNEKSPYSDIKTHGYRSGRRSSIIPCRKIKYEETISESDWIICTDEANKIKYVADFEHGTTLIRAKGCGMWLKSFDIFFPSIKIERSFSKFAPTGKTVVDVYGVSYYSTSLHEMSSTNQIEANLNKIGLVCANHSIGFWIYRKIECDSSPLVDKTVSMFETLGDYRLESHLLTGLERLLVKKYDDSFAKKVLLSISPLFESMPEKVPNSKCPSFTKTYRVSANSLKQKISDGSFFCLDDFELNDFNDFSLRKNGLIPTIEIYERIKNVDSSFLNMAKLFGQIGFECGKCISVIHRSGFIWGFFEDNQPGNFQCNSHCNNLIVLSKEQCLATKKKVQILAPLDFDMAFHKDSTVDLNKKPPVPDPSYFINNVFSEFNFIITDIGGFCATNEDSITAIKKRPQPPGLLEDLLWLLRDCAVYEFYHGYQKVNSERCNGNDISVDDMYDIIYEALNESIHENS